MWRTQLKFACKSYAAGLWLNVVPILAAVAAGTQQQVPGDSGSAGRGGVSLLQQVPRAEAKTVLVVNVEHMRESAPLTRISFCLAGVSEDSDQLS